MSLPPSRFALLLATGLVGCAALPELDWNPLLRVEHAADGTVEIEALGPFVDVRVAADGTSHALRPLYQRKVAGDDAVVDVLAPFSRWRRQGGRTDFRFWPLVWTGRREPTPEGTKWSTVVFPLVFTGGGPEDDDGYFAFFPIAGRTRSLFGIDTFDFLLWPLFMRTHMEVTEPSDSWTVLLLGGWTTGGPRDGSWRALPFYRRRLVRNAEGELVTDQRTVLWPFFTWGDDHLQTDAPSERTSFWPLYGYERSETWSKLTVLWPFFRWHRELAPPPGEEPEFWTDAPWPLYRNRRGDDLEEFRVFPFYARQSRSGLESRVWAIPFVWWREARERDATAGFPPVDVVRTDRWVVPFFHRGRRTVEGHDGADEQWQLWPLAHDAGRADGVANAGTLSIVPFRQLAFMRPAEELWGFLGNLWSRRSDGVSTEWRMLFETILVRRSPEGLRVSTPFLYARRPEEGGTSRHQALWGAAVARTDADGLRSLSAFGLPLWSR